MIESRILQAQFPNDGVLEWIGIRPARHAPMEERESLEAIADKGLAGDRTAAGRGGGKRQVTFIQAEHLPIIAALLKRDELDPMILRRNIVVSGINLTALRGRRFQIGEAIFLGTGPCAPCSKMEEDLGTGGYNAMRGHGGLTAKVLRGGFLRRGDAVRALPDESDSD
ncbi:MAG: MOSC domain-containing protein [Myxococcota bacterium]